MSSTIQLQSTYNWAFGFGDFEPLNIGSGSEPAITNANTVLQTILGPPFKWNWNRTTTSFTTTSGIQDTLKAISDFGFIESASATLGTNTFAFKEVKQELSVGTEPGRPQSIAAQFDDNAGNITFRCLPVPDNTYTVTVTYQQAVPALFTALTGTWAPIPDRYSYIYNYGFLALALAYYDDPRFPLFNQKFVAHLLGTQQGLTETERNLFIDTWNLIARQEALMGIKTQQGRQALGT
jgi:hypothetical protein